MEIYRGTPQPFLSKRLGGLGVGLSVQAVQAVLNRQVRVAVGRLTVSRSSPRAPALLLLVALLPSVAVVETAVLPLPLLLLQGRKGH